MESILKLSAFEIAALIKNNETTPLEVYDTHVDLIQKYNPILNAAVEFNFEEGRKKAKKYTEELTQLESVPALFGVPFTCKEMLAIKGFKRTGGSVYYKNHISQETATVFQRIDQAGGILLATTNIPEFGFWFETKNQVYGRTSNPYNEKRTSGGSSGGEGALIGLGASPFGLASDIGGSIRIPASFCGVFGHKPSAGIIPLTGHFPLSHEELKNLTPKKYPMTTVGPICRSAKDLLPLVKIIKGPDGIDPKCQSINFNFEKAKPKKIFYCANPLIHGASQASEEVQNNILKAVSYLKEVGYKTEELPHDFFIKAIELWFNELNKMDRVSFVELISPEKKLNLLQELPKMIMGNSVHTLPTFILSIIDNFNQSIQDKDVVIEKLSMQLDDLRNRLSHILNNENVLLFPTQPNPAPLHNHLFTTPFDFIYCGIFNALKNPSTQVPIGMSSNELPIGMQIVGPLYHDHLGINLAEEMEMAFGGWIPPKFKS
jgi:fatty acid amide hydrolase 2